MALFGFFRRHDDRDRFAERVMKRARERGFAHPMTYDRAAFAILLGQDGSRFQLQNVHRDWAEAPSQFKTSAFEDAVSTFLDMKREDSLEDSLPFLFPAVRNRESLSSFGLAMVATLEDGVVRLDDENSSLTLCGALSIVLTVDRERSISLLGEGALKKWGQTFDALLPRAIKNLRAKSPLRFRRDPAGFYVSQYEDEYDCSRLLIPELFDQLQLKGDPVAIAATKTCLVVTGSQDKAALLAMADFVRKLFETARKRPISSLPLIRRHGAWEVFSPDDKDLEVLRQFAAEQTLNDYETQAAALKAFFERTGGAAVPGEIEGHRFGGRIYTVAKWTIGAPTLLAKADAVAIYYEEEKAWLRTWEDIAAALGASLKDESLYPPRFSTPPLTRAELEAIAKPMRPPAWAFEPRSN